MTYINEDIVRKKVQHLMKDMGVSKKKLGEVLGSQGDHVNVRINRANRFLSGEKKKITLQEINKIANFFGKPTTWFFLPESSSVSENGSINPENALSIIEAQLHHLGFSAGHIQLCTEQLRALMEYQKSIEKNLKKKK